MFFLLRQWIGFYEGEPWYICLENMGYPKWLERSEKIHMSILDISLFNLFQLFYSLVLNQGFYIEILLIYFNYFLLTIIIIILIDLR
jgi:hypothetical protein